MQELEMLDSGVQPGGANAPAWRTWRPSRRTTIIALAVAGGVLGLLFGWRWVAAAGLSSLVLGLLPCAAMCAAGLCMNRMGQKHACGKSGAPAAAPQPYDSRVNTATSERDIPPLDNAGAAGRVSIVRTSTPESD